MKKEIELLMGLMIGRDVEGVTWVEIDNNGDRYQMKFDDILECIENVRNVFIKMVENYKKNFKEVKNEKEKGREIFEKIR